MFNQTSKYILALGLLGAGAAITSCKETWLKPEPLSFFEPDLTFKDLGGLKATLVACERNPAVKVSGRLNFMVSAGGVRYLVIRLKPAPRSATIAMLAHELQHAAEIADTPSIVDSESLGREYERIGYRSRAAHGGLAFDTRAAVETGRRVAEELTSAEQVARRVAP